jgi:hypothetical protein
MKINLIKHEGEGRAEYQNIFMSDEAIEQLPTNGCTEIMMANSNIDYINDPTFDAILGKLRHSAVLEIEGTDCLEAARGVYLGILDENQMSELLANGRHRLTHVTQISNYLQERGLSIEFASTNQSFYHIRARRP